LTVTVLFLWGALSDERTGLSFVYAAGPRKRSLSLVLVPRDLRPYFTVSVFETSLFVASYDSQGHGGGIRPRLHTVLPPSPLFPYSPVSVEILGYLILGTYSTFLPLRLITSNKLLLIR
jgi:hypothetical protein